MRELGLRVDIEARQHDIPGLVSAVRQYFVGKGEQPFRELVNDEPPQTRLPMTSKPAAPIARKAIGIDFGTTFSAMAHVDESGKGQIIPNAESERITPSVILFDGNIAIVGSAAKQNAVAEPEKIVDFIKREIGKSKGEFSSGFRWKNMVCRRALRVGVSQAQAGWRKIPGRSDHRRSHHRSGLFQRH